MRNKQNDNETKKLYSLYHGLLMVCFNVHLDIITGEQITEIRNPRIHPPVLR